MDYINYVKDYILVETNKSFVHCYYKNSGVFRSWVAHRRGQASPMFVDESTQILGLPWMTYGYTTYKLQAPELSSIYDIEFILWDKYE